MGVFLPPWPKALWDTCPIEPPKHTHSLVQPHEEWQKRKKKIIGTCIAFACMSQSTPKITLLHMYLNILSFLIMKLRIEWLQRMWKSGGERERGVVGVWDWIHLKFFTMYVGDITPPGDANACLMCSCNAHIAQNPPSWPWLSSHPSSMLSIFSFPKFEMFQF